MKPDLEQQSGWTWLRLVDGSYVEIKTNDVFIITNPEFKAGFKLRHDAIIRVCPVDPLDKKRIEAIRNFGTVLYNDIYEKQRQVGPPDW